VTSLELIKDKELMFFIELIEESVTGVDERKLLPLSFGTVETTFLVGIGSFGKTLFGDDFNCGTLNLMLVLASFFVDISNLLLLLISFLKDKSNLLPLCTSFFNDRFNLLLLPNNFFLGRLHLSLLVNFSSLTEDLIGLKKSSDWSSSESESVSESERCLLREPLVLHESDSESESLCAGVLCKLFSLSESVESNSQQESQLQEELSLNVQNEAAELL
jgi:hypothetical protein